MLTLVRQFRTTAGRVRARLDFGDQRGASAVEYGLMVALIAAAVIVAVLFLGRTTSGTFSCSAELIRTSAPPC